MGLADAADTVLVVALVRVMCIQRTEDAGDVAAVGREAAAVVGQFEMPAVEAERRLQTHPSPCPAVGVEAPRRCLFHLSHCRSLSLL